MALLSRYEKILGCLISRAAEADFVKTSTGFGPGGATAEDVELMRRVVGPVDVMGVKAAGGIRTLSDATSMLQAGANRLGASSGVKLVQESEGADEHR
jgi:deoxyribose-phosphate aldolase